MRNFKALAKAANVKLMEVKSYLDSNMEVFGGMNLKLYDISYNPELQEKYSLSDNEYNDYFNAFCECEYDCFMDWMQEEKIEDVREYVGHSSTFYLSGDIVEAERCGSINYDDTISNAICNDYNGYTDIYYILSNGLVDLELIDKYCNSGNKDYIEGNIQDLKEDLEYIIKGNVLEYLKYKLEDAIKINDYIKSFKKNQVQIFDEFLDDMINE